MDWTLFALFLAGCIAAGSTGAMFPPGAWYERLEKPGWTPPNWLFPVAWTTLYICISVAGARAGTAGASGYAMAFFALQLALNTLWTPVFFGLRQMGRGMIVLVALWLAVLATLIAFWRVDQLAGLLFVPYLAWVTVAGALNWSVWKLNPNVPPLNLSD
ncbi:MAG: TspO/MBR family protein [Pseudomonadota bacterium]